MRITHSVFFFSVPEYALYALLTLCVQGFAAFGLAELLLIYLCCFGNLLFLELLLVCTCLYMRSVYEYCTWVYCPIIYCLIQYVLEYFSREF